MSYLVSSKSDPLSVQGHRGSGQEVFTGQVKKLNIVRRVGTKPTPDPNSGTAATGNSASLGALPVCEHNTHSSPVLEDTVIDFESPAFKQRLHNLGIGPDTSVVASSSVTNNTHLDGGNGSQLDALTTQLVSITPVPSITPVVSFSPVTKITKPQVSQRSDDKPLGPAPVVPSAPPVSEMVVRPSVGHGPQDVELKIACSRLKSLTVPDHNPSDSASDSSSTSYPLDSDTPVNIREFQPFADEQEQGCSRRPATVLPPYCHRKLGKRQTKMRKPRIEPVSHTRGHDVVIDHLEGSMYVHSIEYILKAARISHTYRTIAVLSSLTVVIFALLALWIYVSSWFLVLSPLALFPSLFRWRAGIKLNKRDVIKNSLDTDNVTTIYSDPQIKEVVAGQRFATELRRTYTLDERSSANLLLVRKSCQEHLDKYYRKPNRRMTYAAEVSFCATVEAYAFVSTDEELLAESLYAGMRYKWANRQRSYWIVTWVFGFIPIPWRITIKPSK